jgi:hypothetical protein
MRYVLAVFVPWVAFFTMGKVGQGFLCFFLQLTLIGWPVAALWASFSVANFYDDRRTDRVVNAIQKTNSAAPPSPSAPHIPDYDPLPRRQEPPRPIPTVESYLRSSPQNSSPRASPQDGLSGLRSPQDSPSPTSYDERKWRALLRFDDEIAAAAKAVRAFGAQWEDELARSYLRLNDKSYLNALVAKITREARVQSV